MRRNVMALACSIQATEFRAPAYTVSKITRSM
jgi:hypothetical protein